MASNDSQPPAPIDALFDELAHDYDELRREVGWDPWPHIEAMLGPGRIDELKILDVGCAAGEVCQRLGRRGAMMTGLDISAQMCAIAQQRAPRAHIMRHDLQEALPLANDTFDRVIALGVLEFCEDIESTIEELIRVLKPGGELLAVVELCGPGMIGEQAHTISLYQSWRRYRMSAQEVTTLATARLSAVQLEPVRGYLQDEHQAHVEYMRVIGKKP